MIIYFVFKKTSKQHMDKYKWLLFLKLISAMTIFTLLSLGIKKMYKINLSDDDVKAYG